MSSVSRKENADDVRYSHVQPVLSPELAGVALEMFGEAAVEGGDIGSSE